MKKALDTARLKTLLCLALVLPGSFLPLAGCKPDERQQTRDQLRALDDQSGRMRQVIANQESDLQSMIQRLAVQRSQLEEYDASVSAYMLNHKMATAAIAAGVGGASTYLDKENAYSDNAKQIGAGLAFAAAIWVLANLDEVSEVVGVLNQADAHVRALRVSMTQTSSAIAQQQAVLQQNQNSLSLMTQQTVALQAGLRQ